jgi:hypothetical protein
MEKYKLLAITLRIIAITITITIMAKNLLIIAIINNCAPKILLQ